MTSAPEPTSRQPWSAPTGRPDDPAWYSRRAEALIYLLAACTYVGLGIFHKFLLNWIIGPIWLIAWVWLTPIAVERIRGLRRG